MQYKPLNRFNAMLLISYDYCRHTREFSLIMDLNIRFIILYFNKIRNRSGTETGKYRDQP